MPGKSEHVLLADPVVGRILFIGISCGIMLFRNPLHPGIDGKCIRVMQAEKRHTACHLCADAKQGFQDGGIVGLRPTEALPAVVDPVQIKIIVYLYGYFYEKLLI